MNKHILTALSALALLICSCSAPKNTDTEGRMLRGEATEAMDSAMTGFLNAIAQRSQKVQSIMVMQHGKVVAEKWMNGGDPDSAHIMMSVSKTFTALSVGFAISDSLLSLEDKMVSFFPEELPANPSENLLDISVEDLLTMSCGHSYDPTWNIMNEESDSTWTSRFMTVPVEHKPGTYFWYNTIGTYMLSAIVQQVTGKKVVDYLQEKFFDPLCIEHPRWEESPQGICKGGVGLYLKTEDLAKTGQCMLQGGMWNGRQVIPADWVKAMTSKHIENDHFGGTPDWKQGYCYQMWICTHGCVRADGAFGQYIILVPEKDAVIVATADLGDMQAELDTIWEFILPGLE